MRDPSLHITQSRLIEILVDIYSSGEEHLGIDGLNKEAMDLSNKIMLRAKTYSIPSRSITVTNDKLLKKTDKLKLSARSDTAKFAQLLHYNRRALKHRGLQLIEPGSSDWFGLKEVAKLATDFCNEFQIEIKSGYAEYIKLGLPMMKNFSIYKFKTIHSGICNKYEALQEILQDDTPARTKEAHDVYIAIISEKVGFSQGYQNIPEKYKYFIEVKKEAKKFSLSIKQYLQAQFSSFDWRSGVPDPAQLTGAKAVDRLQRWAFENSIKLGNKKTQVDFKAIRKGGSKW